MVQRYRTGWVIAECPDSIVHMQAGLYRFIGQRRESDRLVREPAEKLFASRRKNGYDEGGRKLLPFEPGMDLITRPLSVGVDSRVVLMLECSNNSSGASK